MSDFCQKQAIYIFDFCHLQDLETQLGVSIPALLQ